MKLRMLFSSTVSLLALPVSAIAETGPPLAFDTRLNAVTGERSVEQIVLKRGGDIQTYRIDQLIRPTVDAYAQAPARIPVAFGSPAPIDTPTGLQRDTGAELPSTPGGADRIDVLTDEFTNSALLNIAEDIPGLVLSFPEPLRNASGPDFVVAELGLPKGVQSNGCPGVAAPGADRLTVSIPNGQRITIAHDAFGEFGPAGMIANHGNAELMQSGVRVASISELEQADFEPLAAIDYFRIWVVAVDLSDLGIPEGESVAQVELRAAGIPTETEVGSRNCWLIDPAFVMGLPTE